VSDDSNNPAVDLEVMLMGEVPIPHAYVFRSEVGNRFTRLAAVLRPGGEVVRSACLAYAVRHPSEGTVLIDTGFHPDASESLRKDFGTLMGLFFRGLTPADPPFDEQLHAVGIGTGEVERVLMTHLHVDHTSGMRLLPNAKFVCTRDEWEATKARSAAGKGYVAHHLPPESRTALVDFEASGEPYGPFSKTIDLFGDGSIRLISTPGHTPGHQSVLLRVSGGGEVLVVGDAVYTLRSLREEILPLITAGDKDYLRSLRELKAFSEQHPEATIVPSHDPTAWHELRKLPRPAAARAASIAERK
jgi:N-acyl homoserine lactone hydrolase